MCVKTNHKHSLSNYQIHLNFLLLQLLVKRALKSHKTSAVDRTCRVGTIVYEEGRDPCNDSGNEGAQFWSKLGSHATFETGYWMILENGEVFEDCDNDKENGKGCARTELFFFSYMQTVWKWGNPTTLVSVTSLTKRHLDKKKEKKKKGKPNKINGAVGWMLGLKSNIQIKLM